ncbi:GGDEF domain-containing protein [Rhodococcus sp. OK302]|uniref:GGDEF domain-containing protein n=1 Tax=Rhodococcus sp. OK302 TaxID=1882769 RepID=UPI000B9F991D|nr:GGDEF domain-containing protein [Rhodococcus sp. OK302]OYD70194.1 diguanylate cyclase (GGDEF)-like protein [Rhodococcus sp. OK302]
MKPLRDVAERWLAVPDQFDRFTRFLRDNGLLSITRNVIGLMVISMGLTILLKRLGTQSSQVISFPLDLIIGVLAIIGGVALPKLATTRERSYQFVIAGDLAIAIIVLTEANLEQRLMGSLVFGLVGSYIAFFHNVRAQIWHLSFSTVVIIVASIGVFTDAPTTAFDVLGRIIFAISLITVMPLLTQIALALLSNDAQSSELDPLTDLLNRRGLTRRTSELVRSKSRPGQSLLVVVIDIDRFKHFNDTYGHDVGDRVILRTANRLTEWARPDAAVARVGGDEFVVVQIMPLAAVGELLSRIHGVMNGSLVEPRSTTSIGIAIHNGLWSDTDAMDAGVDELHRLADSAMYESKRLGGDRVHTIVMTSP